jgi:Tol biopolymer transport system component/serine/threonine protein kinase
MTPERYQQVGKLFDEALEHAPEERAAFLKQATGDDAELRVEIEKLLAHQVASAEFLSRPALDVAAALLAQNQTHAAVGQQISHYRILALLGAGGMGEVYLAIDMRLQRKVALKVLPRTIAGEADRLRRFEQEAFAASALNHPNILTIFEFGTEGETQFIVSELVQGETLRTRLQRDRLALSETLDLTMQIASALHTAHEAGITHRDIKPENLMLRPDGIIKVLDFGLVKLTEPLLSPADTKAPTPTKVSTKAGTVLGTTRYMSPEQARGLEVDARTDIFSLGVVIYELVAGRAPFEGPSANDEIAAILTQVAPPLSNYLPAVPAELERIIGKALEKDREERYQSVKDLLFDVKRLKHRMEFEAELARSAQSGDQAATNGPVAIATAQQRHSHTVEEIARPTTSVKYLIGATKRHKLGAALTLASLLATGTGLYFWLAPFGRPQAPPPTASIIPFTTFSGAADQPAFSPDGNQIAFAWDGGNGENLDLYVKLIGAGTPLRLTTDPAEDISPAWSPDGRHLAFFRRSASENGIFIVPALGGAERKLGQTEPNLTRQAPSQCRLSWSPDGSFVAIADRASPQDRYSIFLVSVEDREKQKLTSPPESSDDIYPAFSPDGQTLAFIRSSRLNSGDLYLISMQGGKLQRLTADEQRVHSFTWTADGREIVFSSNRGGGFGLWRVAVSGGTPERVAATGQNSYSPAISRQGDRLAFNVSFLDSNIWRLDRSNIANQAAGALQNFANRLIFSTRQDHSPQFSPDGKRIVFASDRSGSDELWVSESDGSHPAQLTFFAGQGNGTPRWSPDGLKIVFDARPAGNSDIYVVSAEGGKPSPLIQEPSHDVMPSWSRDGRWVYFCSNRSGTYQTWKVPAAGGQAIQVTRQGGFESFESADGKLLYYTKGRGPGGIWQMPVAGGEERQVPELLDAGYWRYWAVLDNGIYFVAPVATTRAALKYFNFATRRVMQLGVLERDPLKGPPGLTVSPDGRWVLYAQVDQSISDIMLVENFR